MSKILLKNVSMCDGFTELIKRNITIEILTDRNTIDNPNENKYNLSRIINRLDNKYCLKINVKGEEGDFDWKIDEMTFCYTAYEIYCEIGEQVIEYYSQNKCSFTILPKNKTEWFLELVSKKPDNINYYQLEFCIELSIDDYFTNKVGILNQDFRITID
jgi:hypothetical protein